MKSNIKYKLGILAYGSLIDFPGEEIRSVEIDRVPCLTPFKVEFARKSSTRGDAPTLIPSDNLKIGKNVNAFIIILDNKIAIGDAKSMLWRREIHKVDKSMPYKEPERITVDRVVVKEINNFMDVETVLYTSIGSNIEEKITPNLLAELAINSFLKGAGKNGKDGIRYLLSAKKNKIITEFSEEYEKQILYKTEAKNLDEAIILLDSKFKN